MHFLHLFLEPAWSRRVWLNRPWLGHANMAFEFLSNPLYINTYPFNWIAANVQAKPLSDILCPLSNLSSLLSEKSQSVLHYLRMYFLFPIGWTCSNGGCSCPRCNRSAPRVAFSTPKSQQEKSVSFSIDEITALPANQLHLELSPLLTETDRGDQ